MAIALLVLAGGALYAGLQTLEACFTSAPTSEASSEGEGEGGAMLQDGVELELPFARLRPGDLVVVSAGQSAGGGGASAGAAGAGTVELSGGLRHSGRARRPAVFMLGFGVYTALLIYNAGLLATVANSMLPTLRPRGSPSEGKTSCRA